MRNHHNPSVDGGYTVYRITASRLKLLAGGQFKFSSENYEPARSTCLDLRILQRKYQLREVVGFSRSGVHQAPLSSSFRAGGRGLV